MSTVMTPDAGMASTFSPGRAARTPRSLQLGPRLPSILVFLTGLFNLWSAITPALVERLKWLQRVLPFDARPHGAFTAALLGLALLFLAHGLWRRKQIAWFLTLVALLISVPVHLIKGFDWEEAVIALGVAGLLWAWRREWMARSDAPSVRVGLIALGGAFGATLLYGTMGFFLLDSHFRVHFDVAASAWQTAKMFWFFSSAQSDAITRHGAWFADSIYGVALCSFAVAAWMLARPVLVGRVVSDAELERARDIVETHGDNAFAFCALLPDKRYFFCQSGAVVAYALVGRVAVAMGDPIGPPEKLALSVAEFARFCRGNDWRVAFYEIYQESLSAHQSAGLETLAIAQDATIALAPWTTEGKAGKGARAVINAFAKAGFLARLHTAPLSDDLLAQLRAVSDEWLASRNGAEKGFSLGWFEEEMIRHCDVMAVENENGQVFAFANLVPCFKGREATIDLMRHRHDAPRNSMEFLFLSLFEWAKSRGYDAFNLGPAPFSGVGQDRDDPIVEQAIHLMYKHMNGFYNFKGLRTFKEKFRPQWRTIYLSYEGKTGLPLVAAAIVRADSGQDSWFDFVRSLRGQETQREETPREEEV